MASDSADRRRLRSRKHGAAVPLDDVDKQLLNLMQGSFPIEPRPYQRVAELAEMTEDEVMTRVQHLLDERIIRQVTPIFDTRALGYASMLVAAKVDPENPHRAAKVINAHPGVSHNYLRNHDFNIWFTIATEPDSKLGLQGTLDVLAEEAGAESVRQLPTLKMFKIRMDLEMEGGTDALATQARGRRAGGDGPAALRRLRHRRDPRAPGRHADRPRAVRARRRRARHRRSRSCSSTSRGCGSASCSAAWPRSCSTAAPASRANGMGVWNVPEGEELEYGKRMAAFRGISHCYQRPTYADWPYSVFTMAHGRSKEECDAILDAIAEETGIEDRATLYSSTEFKKIRLLYFTDDFKRWEAEHGAVSDARAQRAVICLAA